MTPPFEQVVIYDTQNQTDPIEFKVPGIKDANAGDRIYWRWFLNYDAASNPVLSGEGLATGRVQGALGATITYPLLPCVDQYDVNRKRHRVEVIVTDRPFLEDDGTTARFQHLSPDAGQFRIVWYVESDTSRCLVAR